MRKLGSLIGKKKGMIHIFDEDGSLVPCSVISIEPNVVVQIKSFEKDGYTAVQMGSEDRNISSETTLRKRVTKPLLGHMKKAGEGVFRHIREVRLDAEDSIDDFSLGQSFGLESLEDVSFVDIRGVSKGKGFQGVMKKFGFRGGPGSHGSGFHRHAGSTGMRSTPGRCFPGSKRPSHLGMDNVTVKNLRVMKIDLEKKVLLVKGAIPGSRGSMVVVECSPKNSVK